MTTAVDNSISERQAEALKIKRQADAVLAEAAVTMLETIPQREALKPHLMRLKVIVKDLEIDGDHELVEALSDIEYDPTTRCNERALVCNDNDGNNNDNNNNGERDDKMCIRDHTRTVRFLARKRKELKQQSRQLVEDYDSSSICSSDYDIDCDREDGSDTMFGEGPSFEGNTTYDEDEDSSVSEYDTKSESFLLDNDSYASHKRGC
jgi:hypothetical protein